MITFLEMYKNIAKKYGKDSLQLKTFKDYCMYFQDKPNVVRRVYKMIMYKK